MSKIPETVEGDDKRRRAIRGLYAELPTITCAGKCAESCGPVFMGRIEWENMCRAKGERKADMSTLTCPYLESERCTAYKVRPMLCRLWGVVESMPCLWGCKPDRYLTDEEGYEFLRRVAAIQGGTP